MEDNGLEFLLDAVDRFPLCEEFANILDHGDPVPLAVLSWNCATSVESADSNVGSGCGQRVGGVSQVWEEGSGRRRREASPTRSEQLTEGESGGARMNNKLRLGSVLPDRTHFLQE
ncbi:uncharacterized protein [Triticum aestivum]|uniref:uncharacterized protein n=1 Tax=Triticum aestivum TaxID=4565 RepID=UPI001D02E3AE|nr:uncharacterized protein LOC123165979 [Triticum aestivum]